MRINKDRLNDGNQDPHGIFEYVGSVPHVDLDKEDNTNKLLDEYGCMSWEVKKPIDLGTTFKER